MPMNDVSRLMRLLAVALLSGLAVVPSVQASCHLVPYSDGTPFVPDDMVLDMGRIVVPAELPNGGLIREIVWPQISRNAVLYCTAGGQAFGEFINAKQKVPVPGYSNVFPTDVEGVGIRVTESVMGGARPLPFTQGIPAYFVGRGALPIGTGQVKYELIKTAEQTGSGRIAPLGPFGVYYLDEDGPGKPMRKTSFGSMGTIIINASCSVRTKDIHVNLGTVPNATFTGVGSRSIGRYFDVTLRCQGHDGYSEGSNTMVRIRLDDVAGNSSVGDGVLKIGTGAEAAKRIGIQVTRRTGGGVETPITLGQSMDVGRIVPGGVDLSLLLRASYIQTQAGTVGPGLANGKATFTIDYL